VSNCFFIVFAVVKGITCVGRVGQPIANIVVQYDQ